MVCGLILVLVLSIFPVYPVQAATKYTGRYCKTYKVKGIKASSRPAYTVIINKVKNKKIKFQVSYTGVNASPIYDTIVTAKLKNKTASFKWKDSWGNSGTGKIKLYKKYIKIKMKQTKTAEGNRASLDTGGKYIKINKKSNNKKMYTW